MKRRWIKIVVAIAAVVIAVGVLVPLFVNADSFRPMLQNELSSALGRKVTLGHMSFSLFGGGLTARNIAIADDPAFSTAPFIGARSLRIGVKIAPLLFNHRVRVTKLYIDSPTIQLIQAQNGSWNFASLGGASTTSAPQQQSALPNFSVGELTIKNGSATVSSIPPKGKPFFYNNVEGNVHQFSLAKSSPFQIAASLPGNGTLKMSGAAGPLAPKNAVNTPFHASLQVMHLDPVAADIVDRASGISTVADIDAQLASDGKTVNGNGKIHAARLQLARVGSPAPNPVNIDFNVSNDLSARTGKVSDLAIHTGSVALHTTGSYHFTPQAMVLNLRLNVHNLPVDQVEQLLPAVGVHLPPGSTLRGGALTANLAITGPASAASVAGPVEINNTQLEGFNLGSKIEGINPLGGTGNSTQIQTVRADVNSSPQGRRFTNIYASMSAIGSATGSGTVSPSGALNFNMLAKLNSTSGIGAAGQAASSVGGMFDKVFHNNKTPTPSKGIPLTITGTTSNPSIRANVGAMLK